MPPRIRKRGEGELAVKAAFTEAILIRPAVSERDKHLPHMLAAEVECADALTRLLISAGFRGFDLDGAVAEKRAYNAEREDHKPENRRKEGGKAF